MGASATIYPALLVPVFAVALWRREPRPHGDLARFGLGFGLVAGAVNGPFLLANPGLFWETYAFHLARGPNYEGLWHVLGFFAAKLGAPAPGAFVALVLGTILTVSFVGGYVFVLRRVGQGTLDLRWGAFAAVLLFLLLNKVFSVQYALWVLPFFALLILPRPRFAAFVAADAAVFVLLFSGFARIDEAVFGAWYAAAGVAVLLRTSVLIWLLSTCLRLEKHEETTGSAEPDSSPG